MSYKERYTPLARITRVDDPRIAHIAQQYNVRAPFIHKGFHALFYPIDFVQLIWNRWGEYEGYYVRLHISLFQNSYWDLYYLPDEFTRLRNHYFQKIRHNPSFLKKHYTDWKKSCRILDRQMHALDVALGTEQFSGIQSAYDAMIETYLFEYALAAPIQEACGFQPEQWIIPAIESYCRDAELDYQETVALLTSPVVPSFISLEEKGLLTIAIAAKAGQSPRTIHKMLEEHQEKWFWIQNNYAKFPVLSITVFQERLEALMKESRKVLKKKIGELCESTDMASQKKRVLFKKYKPSPLLRLYVRVNEFFSEMQDVRKAYVLRANHFHRLFLENAASELGQPIDNLWNYSYRELQQTLKTRNFLTRSALASRRAMIVEVQSKKEKIIFSGAAARTFSGYLAEDITATTECRGIVAETGKREGVVRVVLKTHDILKVREGDILVASMTRPEMVAAMKKAAAFVTDEGGITCHAAIVAREMHKPCVIGTKIATKIFHDGDYVEVDATAGVVRKI